jgi:hypothetical protein
VAIPSKLAALLIVEVVAIIIAVPIIIVARPESVAVAPAEAVEAAVREALAPPNRGMDRVTAVSVGEGDGGEVGVVLTLNAGLPGLRGLDAKGDVVAVLRAIRHTGVAYDQVVVHATFPLVGPLGGISEEPVISAVYSRSVVDATDWERFVVEGVYLIADGVELLADFAE